MIVGFKLIIRWAVENQIGKKDLVISECDSKQSVYVFGCKESVLQIQGNFAPFQFTVKVGYLLENL